MANLTKWKNGHHAPLTSRYYSASLGGEATVAIVKKAALNSIFEPTPLQTIASSAQFMFRQIVNSRP